MFKNGPSEDRFSSHETPLELGESNWKMFLEPRLTDDVIILSKDKEHVECHKHYLTRGSRVLFNQLSGVGRKPLIIEMKELTRTQIVAFLRYQYSGNTDQILESTETSLLVLKEAERLRIGNLWDDTVSGLLLKNSNWFELDFLVDFKYYLETCSRQQNSNTRELTQKIFKRLREITTTICLTKCMDTCKDGYSIIDDLPHGQLQIQGRLNISECDKDGEAENAFLTKVENGNFVSQRMLNQVRLWFSKREWNIKITGRKTSTQTNRKQPKPRKNDTDIGRWKIFKLEIVSNDVYHQPQLPRQQYSREETMQIPAEIEFLVEIGDCKVFGDNMVQTIFKNGEGRFHQNFQKIKQAKGINQLSKSGIRMTVFASHRNVESNAHVRSLDDLTLHLIETNWEFFLDQRSTDATILAKNGELIHCHRRRFARYSRILLESNELVFKMQELTRAQVEAFLRYQYCRATDKIVESPLTSLLVLKQAERFDIKNMWDDTLSAILLKSSDWFTDEFLLELKIYLGTCTKRCEILTETFHRKLSQLLEESSHNRNDTPETRQKEASSSSESFVQVVDDFDTNVIEKLPEQGPYKPQPQPLKINLDQDTVANENGFTVEQRCEDLDKILESTWTSLAILKVAEYYRYDQMWSDIISALLLKGSGWFEGYFNLELVNFLTSCSKRDEEPTQNLFLKITRLQEESNGPIELATVATNHAHQNQEIEQGNQNGGHMAGQVMLMKLPNKCNSSSVGEDNFNTVPTEIASSVRRSSRLKVQKPKPVQKRGLQLDETWQAALERYAKRKKHAIQPGREVYGPRDIWKDSTLPKIAIIPGPEVKVEKVEPPEEWSEATSATDADAQQRQIVLLQDPDSSTDDFSLLGFVKLETGQ